MEAKTTRWKVLDEQNINKVAQIIYLFKREEDIFMLEKFGGLSFNQVITLDITKLG